MSDLTRADLRHVRGVRPNKAAHCRDHNFGPKLANLNDFLYLDYRAYTNHSKGSRPSRGRAIYNMKGTGQSPRLDASGPLQGGKGAKISSLTGDKASPRSRWKWVIVRDP